MATMLRSYAELPINPATRRNPGWWVMTLVITTEAMLFAYLLFAYFYLGSMTAGEFPTGGAPDLKLALPNTIILLVSSGTMYWAERGIRAGSQFRLRLGMAITLVLGVIFLVVQGIEYSHKSFAPQTNAYGGLFFTITGFHGAHVFVGLLMNVVVQIWAWRGWFGAGRHLAVTNAAMYWHFVDAVWLVVFFSLYITPRFS
ncbi:MAG TPA: cytochrome c oxidase subunit 3 [Ramlibacter sp.]|nr:cytochrome c oxidase subunit 3 [Ramlibacter sp.]